MFRINLRLVQNAVQLGRRLSSLANEKCSKSIDLAAVLSSSKINFKPSPAVTQIPLHIPQTPNRKPAIEEFPITPKIIESPRNTLLNEIRDIIGRREVVTPATENSNNEIQAARLIVIRRRKMKKHKLRKLRKKMKYEWAKVRQRREMRKEKAFQAELISQIKEAEKFKAEAYADERLRMVRETIIPRFWRGKRLPQPIMKELLKIK